MFGVELECGIAAVKVKVKGVDGRLVRRCRVTLAHEFTASLARAIGSDAVAVLEGLRTLGIDKADLPMNTIAASGVFEAEGHSCEIGVMTGVRAVATKPKDEGAGPSVKLEFDFAWDEQAWTFLGRHCSSMASVVLTRRQLELPLSADKSVN